MELTRWSSRRVIRGRRFWRCLPLITAMISPLTTAAQQPREEAAAFAVELAVSARDKDGRPIMDLKREEIRVFEDGREQKIEHFLPIDLTKPPEDLPPQITRRNFILFFDVTFNTPAALSRAKQAAVKFVESKMPDGDQAAVFAFSALKGVFMVSNFTSDRRLLLAAVHSIGIERVFDTAADSAGFFNPLLMRAPMDPRLYSMGLGSGSSTPGESSALAQWVRDMNALARRDSIDAYRAAVSFYLERMRQFARSLEMFPGRKFLIFFSTGFDTNVLGVRDLNDMAREGELRAMGDFEALAALDDARSRDVGMDLRIVFEQAMRYFASSDCRVFPVDASGLAGGDTLQLTEDRASDPHATGRRQASLFSFARETGGKLYKNLNAIDEALADILSLTDSFYLVTYTPPHREPKKTPAYHSIKIECERDGVEVSCRRGYNDARPFRDLTEQERRLQVAEIVNYDLRQDGVAFDAQLLQFPVSQGSNPVALVLQVPGQQFPREKIDMTLEIFAFALGPEGRFEAYVHGYVRVPGADLEGKLQEAGIRYSDAMALRPGIPYEVRILIRNNLTGEVGTRTLDVTTLATASSFAIATPFFVAAESLWLNVLGYDPTKPPVRVQQLPGGFPLRYGGRPCPVEIYTGRRQGARLALLLKLYDLSPDRAARRAEVVHIAWEVLDAAGAIVARPPFKLVQSPIRADGGCVDYLFEFDPAALPEAAAWLRIQATDSVTKQVVSEWVSLKPGAAIERPAAR